MTSNTHDDAVTMTGWKYKVTNGLTPEIPFFYLSGIGLRTDLSTTTPATMTGGVDIGATDYDIPLATSVRLERNFVNQNLTAPYTKVVGGTSTPATYTVPYLGFNPLYGVVAPSNPDAVEDALTADQSFYVTDANILNSTLDSRAPSTALVGGDSILLRQNTDLLNLPAGVTAPPLPDYRVRALKLENATLGATPVIKPIDLDIDAYVYAQQGSWFVIPGDYFRSTLPVREDVDTATGTDKGSYIDYNGDKAATPGEFITDASGNEVADLNRNGIADPGEAEAALRFVRYNYQINFKGAIAENQTAIVNDAPGVTGAVADWMDKWAAYDSTATGATPVDKFKFINYTYDPALANETDGSKTLHVPQTGDLLYQQ